MFSMVCCICCKEKQMVQFFYNTLHYVHISFCGLLMLYLISIVFPSRPMQALGLKE